MGHSSDAASTADPPAGEPLPVVGVGASAGGLEAMRQLFAHLPQDTGMAFVVVQHLDPNWPSSLASVLGDITKLPVVEIADGMQLEPDRVHVLGPANDVVVSDGVLTLVERHKTSGLHLPIDTFFRSLAEDETLQPIGVVLSGSGADGTEGLRAIKARGGICIVQDPASASFSSMPEHAIAAGAVDIRCSPERIAGELARLGRHPWVTRPKADLERNEPEGAENDLASILASMRDHANVDFGGYKRSTLLRRIEKRMTLRHADTLADYARMLRDEPVEARALAQDVLIHVTAFFRDPDAFVALEKRVFPELVRRGRETGSIRVWVPGCSTGEEVYSIAIGLVEALGRDRSGISIQLFGTDISREAIETARLGVYTESALAGVSPERLTHHFHRVEGGHRIAKHIRELCVFVEHDLTHDPPFARLDLISCRNVLIYFAAELQRRVIPLLHYCLNDGGYLFLGGSETIAGFRDLFSPLDEPHRIFVKAGEARPLVYPMATSRRAEAKLSEGPLAERRHPAREAQRQADHLLLARFAPPGVVVDERLEIVQFRGRTGAYIEPPPGQPQTNLLRMVREGLVPHVHEAVERAKTDSTTIRKDGVEFLVGVDKRVVSLEVVPLARIPGSTVRYFLVLFEPSSRPSLGPQPPASIEPPREERSETAWLREELVTTKDYLQSLVAEHQTTTDDLAATNEELVAANEELQSTNEELQSAKEELQSTNEELSTLNDQLRSRNEELDRIANDLVNVIASVEIPIIIVDMQLRIRRFTPPRSPVASFIPQDVGRPIQDLKLRVEVTDLASRIRNVIEAVSPAEWEVRSEDGQWFRMQIRPYRTADNRLDGAVIAFVDIDVLKTARQDAEIARDYARAIVDTVATPLVVLDASFCVLTANQAFRAAFVPRPEPLEQTSLLALGERMWDVPKLRRALEETLATRAPFTDLELTIERPDGERKRYTLTGRWVSWTGGEPMVLLAIHDVTELRAFETERSQLLESEKQARLEAERATQAKDVFLAVLSHELRTPLSSILMSAQLLEGIATDDPMIERAATSIERAAHTQARLIEDLLDISRIVSGKLLLNLEPVDFATVVRDAVEQARPSAEAKALTLELVVEGAIGFIYGDPARLQQIVSNLLTNAIKFTPRSGRVDVRLERQDGRAVLTVRDTGMGIPPAVLPRLFSTFTQADSSVTRTHGGLGLGLAIVRHLAEAHGGEVEVQSAGEGKGATFCVTLPMGPETIRTKKVTHTLARPIRGIRVLLVEDDDDTRESYASMLERLGADVRAVGSAAEGLAALDEQPPDVILSDIAMPGEDGFTFIRKVRRRDAAHGGATPAAALTALASDEDRRRALEAGFELHVSKPVDATRLASVVRRLADADARPPEPREDA